LLPSQPETFLASRYLVLVGFLGERWPSRLAATAAEERPKSELALTAYDECIGAKKHLVVGVISARLSTTPFPCWLAVEFIRRKGERSL
jgi:hypothetical protein